MTIYSGWLTAATILNLSMTLKWFGLNDSSLPSWLDEERIGIAILYVAALIYNVASYFESNPLYGAIFVWVVVAIRNDVVNKMPQYTDLKQNLDILGIFQALSMTALASYEAVEKFVEGSDETGLFY